MADKKLGLGDIVDLGWKDGHSNATVTQVHADGTVDLLRVYVHTSDFLCSGRRKDSHSLLAWIGFEEIRDVDPKHYKCVRRNPETVR